MSSRVLLAFGLCAFAIATAARGAAGAEYPEGVRRNALAWFVSLPRLTRVLWLIATFEALMLTTRAIGA